MREKINSATTESQTYITSDRNTSRRKRQRSYPLPFPTGGDKTTSALVKAKQFASGGVLRRRVPVVPRSAVLCEQRCRAAWPMRSRSCQSNEQPLGHVIASGSAPRPASPPPRRRRRRGGAIEGPPSPASSTTIDVNSGDDVSLDIFLRYVH